MSRSVILFLLVSSGVLLPRHAPAHPDLSEYVQHEVALEAGNDYIDLTVRLTFFDRYADLQAAFLDRDSDGRFSSDEQRAFRQEVLESVESQIALYLHDQELPLVARYDPEIHAGAPDSSRQEKQIFEIILHFFARMPHGTHDDALLAVHDGLYPQFAALAAVHVAGKDGIRLSAVGENHDLARPADAGKPLVLPVRLTANAASTTTPIPSKQKEKGAQE